MSQLEALKNPLISEDQRIYIKEQYAPAVRSYYDLAEAPPQVEGEGGPIDAKVQAVFLEKMSTQERELRDQRLAVRDYVNDASSYVKNYSYEDGKNFYMQATSLHMVPKVQILKTLTLKSNPAIFAVVSHAAQEFGDFEILEMMTEPDYKNLTKLRVRNYVSILKTLLTIVDSASQSYRECRKRLFQIRKLVQYLGIYEYEKMYEKLKEYKSFQALQEEEEEEEEGEDPADQEYQDFYKESYFRNDYRYSTSNTLHNEEAKWVKRAAYLESLLGSMRQDPQLISWVPWFQAKMDQLVDLDVALETESAKKSSSVLYINSLLREEVRQKHPTEEYSQDQKVYVEQQTLYPSIKVDAYAPNLDGTPSFKAQSSVREKLCLRIKKREAETQYFLTVFQKKEFGNEKIFEKRLNFGQKDSMDLREFQFHPQGQFIYVQFFKNYYYPVDLVFAVDSQYKDPLLIKNHSTILGFHSKYLYAHKNNVLYQYDLHKFSNVKKMDMIPDESLQYDFNTKFFCRLENGFGYVHKRALESQGQAAVMSTFDIYINKEKHTIDSSAKFPSDYETEAHLNQAGTHLLVVYIQDGAYTFSRFCTDPKDSKKVFKKDPVAFSPIREGVSFETKKISWIRVIPTLKSFIIMVKNKKKSTYVFFDDKYIQEIETEQDPELEFDIDESGAFKGILEQELNSQGAYDMNQIRYRYCQPPPSSQTDKSKQEWTWLSVSYQVYNYAYNSAFPYLFFIYNNDQVFMKDLTKPNLKGYYYMNNYMGIKKDFRALTVYGFTYSDKLTFWVPTVNRTYSDSDYLLRFHSIKTARYETTRFKFEGKLRMRVWTGYQDMVIPLQVWFSSFAEKSGKLLGDIRITSKHNSFSIEKWVSNKCLARILVSNYNSPIPQYLNFADKNTYLQNRQSGKWCFILQNGDQIMLYTADIRFTFKQTDFLSMEPQWTYSDDDNSNTIYDILIDTLPKNEFNLYLVYSNATIKKFSAKLQENNPALNFEEFGQLLSIEALFKGKDNQQSGGGGGKDAQAVASKKIDMWGKKADLFIANSIFYSTNGIIDFKSLTPGEKNTVNGLSLDKGSFLSDPFSLTYSFNEAKLVGLYKYTSTLFQAVVTPLLNSRQLPLWQQNEFAHPIVPIVDKTKGLTSVFTLTPRLRYLDGQHYNQYQWKQRSWDALINLEPGLQIKYFNGIEQKMLMKDFGEEFTQVLKFKQSLDGKFVVIIGTRKGRLVDKNYSEEVQERELNSGLFLYSITSTTIKREKAIVFADKSRDALPQDILDRLNAPQRKEREFVEPEVDGLEFGEYSNSYIDEGCYFNNNSYSSYLTQEQNDEEYIADLRAAYKKCLEEERRRILGARKQTKLSGIQGMASFKNISLTDEPVQVSEPAEPPVPEQTIEQKIAEKYPECTQISGLQENFEGFDIPVKEEWGYYLKYAMNESVDNNLVQERDIPQPMQASINDDQIEAQELPEPHSIDNPVYHFTEQERSKINQIYSNMHLEVNEHGHVFLTNRLNNKLYFFYNCNNQSKLAKLKMEPEFAISDVDASTEYLVVSNSSQYRIFNIKAMLDPSNAGCVYSYEQKSFALEKLAIPPPIEVEGQPKVEIPPPPRQYVTPTPISGSFALGLAQVIPVELDSMEWSYRNVKQETLGVDEYFFSVDWVKISGDLLLLKIIPQVGAKFFRVFNLNKKINQYYIEGERIMLSGDKKFIWMMENDQVYDIINGLSTFFIWPGDQISTPAYYSLDNFNVDDQRTLMSTPGFLQQAFNFISLLIDDQFSSDPQQPNFTDEGKIINKVKIFEYMCYKIGNMRSIMEKMFEDDADKLRQGSEQLAIYEQVEDPSLTAKQREEKETEKADRLSKQFKSLSSLVNFLMNRYTAEGGEATKITNFFFSYYFADHTGVTAENGAQPALQNILQKLYKVGDPRVDIIEDINHFAVQSNIPTLQFAINSVFLELLQTAHTSIAFQDYLKNTTKQTLFMADYEKFQIVASEEGYCLDSHSSPIMDNHFYNKFRKDKETKKDVDIFYIDLGDLLSSKGQEIMELLQDAKYLPIMDIPFIQYLVMYQWNNVRDTIQLKLLTPFYLLLGLFTIYTLFLIDFRDKPFVGGTDDHDVYSYTTIDESGANVTVVGVDHPEGESSSTWAFIKWFAIILALSGSIFYFLVLELRQFFMEPSAYFKSAWNFSDLLNLFLCLSVILMDISGASATYIRPVASITIILLWIKMFYFLRVFESTARLIRMILEIVNDMVYFLMVLSIGVFGFSTGFYILSQGDDQNFAGTSMIHAILYTYRLTLGDFATDNFYGLKTPLDVVLVWLIFFLATIFVVIVLLNLLIAIMGDTFSRILTNITNLSIREKVMLVAENESLFARGVLFQSSQYLIIIKEKNLEAVQAVNNDGQINAMGRVVNDKLVTIQSDFNTKMKDSQVDLKNRFTEQDDKAKKLSAMIETKIISTVESEMQSILSKVTEGITTLQTQITTQQTSISNLKDQMRSVRNIEENIMLLQGQQSKFNNQVYKALNIDLAVLEKEEEELGL